MLTSHFKSTLAGMQPTLASMVDMLNYGNCVQAKPSCNSHWDSVCICCICNVVFNSRTVFTSGTHKRCNASQEDVPKHKGWLQNAAQSQKPQGAHTQDVMIPLEFKTGKPFNGHNAQVQQHRVTESSTCCLLPMAAAPSCCHQTSYTYQTDLYALTASISTHQLPADICATTSATVLSHHTTIKGVLRV